MRYVVVYKRSISVFSKWKEIIIVCIIIIGYSYSYKILKQELKKVKVNSEKTLKFMVCTGLYK